MAAEEVTGIRFMFFVWSQAVLASVRLFGSVQSLGQCVLWLTENSLDLQLCCFKWKTCKKS